MLTSTHGHMHNSTMIKFAKGYGPSEIILWPLSPYVISDQEKTILMFVPAKSPTYCPVFTIPNQWPRETHSDVCPYNHPPTYWPLSLYLVSDQEKPILMSVCTPIYQVLSPFISWLCCSLFPLSPFGFLWYWLAIIYHGIKTSFSNAGTFSYIFLPNIWLPYPVLFPFVSFDTDQASFIMLSSYIQMLVISITLGTIYLFLPNLLLSISPHYLLFTFNTTAKTIFSQKNPNKK